MNYRESKQILAGIKKANKILINCHRNPDPDSIGSALAVKKVLENMGKATEVVCPTKLDKGASFLEGFESIKVVDFGSLNFKDDDLLIVIDSSSWGMVSGEEDMRRPETPIIVIDHHQTNRLFGDTNLIDPKVTSAAELLYRMFADWRVEIDKETATSLLTGIISDTGAFRYSGVGLETLAAASDLIKKGADKDEIIMNLFNNLQLNQVRLLGVILDGLKIDEKHGFAWSAIPYEVYKKYGEPDNAKEYAANSFMQSVSGTSFGMIMVETKEKRLSASLRTRKNVDVSKIALALGGGGHKVAAGAIVSGLKFKDAVKKVLETARKVVNETQN